jgi:nucleoside-diphosphate-sugar epimerase
MSETLSGGSRVLLTGVTGLIGGEVLRRLLARGHSGTVDCLVRPAERCWPGERLVARLARSGDRGPLPANVRAVAGDILRPGWGLEEGETAFNRADVVIHSAADTSFVAHRDTARTNIEGVRHLIELARRRPRPPLIVYVGTASNVGDVTGRCLDENEGCRPCNRHHNEYTQSKAVAESLLRDSGLPVLTVRPTIVLSAGLPDEKFARQILWCVPLTRAFRALPLNPAARLDLVDVEFVAEATVRLAECGTRSHDCYHLSAGPGVAVTVGELAALVASHYGRQPLELVPPSAWSREHLRRFVRTELQRRVFRSLRHYLPFLNMDVVYDDARLRADLGPGALPVRPAAGYLPELLRLVGTKSALREAALP